MTSFRFDISDHVDYDGENVVAARIDIDWDYREKATNIKFQWEDKNFNANYGGINKNVLLHITPLIYQTLPLFTHLGTTGVYIYVDEFNIPGRKATIHAEIQGMLLHELMKHHVQLCDLYQFIFGSASCRRISPDHIDAVRPE